MSEDDAPAPVKKPRSEAQIQALEKARAKALELRMQRNVIREKKKKLTTSMRLPKKPMRLPQKLKQKQKQNRKNNLNQQS